MQGEKKMYQVFARSTPLSPSSDLDRVGTEWA